MMSKIWKYSSCIIWSTLVIFLFVFLQREYNYHFYFIEQNYLFLPNADYISGQMALPGGLANLLGEFVMQYFMYPYAGALVTTVLIALISLLTTKILEHINAGYDWLLLASVPALCLLFMQFDFNYKLAGTIAVLFMLCFLLLAVRIKNDHYRFFYTLFSVFCVYWLLGSVYVPYILLMVFYEFAGKKPLRYFSLVFPVIGVLLGVFSLYFSLLGEYRFAFLPDMFYHNKLIPKPHIYYSWITFVLLFALAFFLKPKAEKKNIRRMAELFLPFLLVVLLAGWGVKEYGDQKAEKVKRLDYFTRQGEWDKILEESKGTLSNYLYISYLNMALAEKSILAERMFQFDQRGVDGLLLKWNRTFSISILLSDIYFTIGNIAVAQEMAFEAYVCAMGEGNPRMLKRLIQTNLIYGEYKIAEKYIRLLEQTSYYRTWAHEHRRFLYNDNAVQQDKLLGEKRRALLSESYLSNTFGVDQDLINIAKQFPANRNAIEYLGGVLLLAKDIQGFSSLLDQYYHTDILPVLPLGFQEAVIILTENTPEEWAKYNIDKTVIDRFSQYKKAILANKNNASLPQIMASNYGNTYWFYFMFK